MKSDLPDQAQMLLDSLDGNVYYQQVKIGHRAWLDIGSAEWAETSDKIKAAAFQAAKASGWSKEALCDLMVRKYKHLGKDEMSMVFEILEQAVAENPIEIEQLTKTDIDVPIRPYKSFDGENKSNGKDVNDPPVSLN